MSASIAFTGSVGACSVQARQSAARPRYQSALDVVSLRMLTIPQRDANDDALVEYTVLLGILLIAVIAHHLAVDQRHSCDDRDSLWFSLPGTQAVALICVRHPWLTSNAIKAGSSAQISNYAPPSQTFCLIHFALFQRSGCKPTPGATSGEKPQMARRQTHPSFVDRLRLCFHRFWNE